MARGGTIGGGGVVWLVGEGSVGPAESGDAGLGVVGEADVVGICAGVVGSATGEGWSGLGGSGVVAVVGSEGAGVGGGGPDG
jgi:hypothetical protein